MIIVCVKGTPKVFSEYDLTLKAEDKARFMVEALMCRKCEGDVSESFAKGLDAISEDKKPRFSVKSREVRSLVREGILGD